MIFYPQVRGFFRGKQSKFTAANIDVFIKIDIWRVEAKRNSIG